MPSLLELAVQNNNLEIVKFLLEKGARMNPKHDYNEGLKLLRSLFNGDVEMFRLFLEHDCETITKFKITEYFDVLTVLCKQGKLKLVELFIRCGANVKGIQNNNAPLEEAIKSNHPEIVKLLFKNGVEFNNPFLVAKMIKIAVNRKFDHLDILIDEYKSNLATDLDPSFLDEVEKLRQKKIKNDSEPSYQWW